MKEITALADVILIEADGAKKCPLKVPASWEPVIWGQTDLVIAVAGMDAAGKPIQEVCHRPENVADFLGKEAEEKVTEEDISKFKAGITLDDGYLCKEAKLEILNASEDGSEIIVTIQEGKFHQVKRMFEAVGKSVIYLKRVEFGTLPLDEDLEEGEYRELTE